MSRGRLTLWAGTVALWVVIAALWLWLPSAPAWAFVSACAALAGLLWVIEATSTRRPAQEPPRTAPAVSGAVVAEAAGQWLAEPYPLTAGEKISWAIRAADAETLGYPIPPPVPDMITAPYPGHDHSPSSPPCPACLATLRMLAGLAGATVETGATRIASPAEVADAQLAADARAIMAGHDAEAASYRARSAEVAAAMLRELGAPLASGPPCGAAWGGHLCRNRPPYAAECQTHRCSCGTTWGRASFLGESYPWVAKPINDDRGEPR